MGTYYIAVNETVGIENMPIFAVKCYEIVTILGTADHYT